MDADFELALRLQEEFDRQEAAAQCSDAASPSVGGCPSSNSIPVKFASPPGSENLSLVDPQWEMLDPNPDIRALFLQFNDRFFWGRLAGVEVRWSPRMTLCAGLCCYEGHGGLCSVRLSQPLLTLRPRKDLIETLLHEMIHAYLFVTDNNKDHDGHGPEFHKHMYRINKETGTNISVYHTFHDEVDHHRQHWWRCDGPCRSKQPYFGYVKRAMNRAPHPRDFWWAEHQSSCGGTYTKVKEPEGYGQKKKTSKDASERPKSTSPVKPKGVPDIRTMFGGSKENKKPPAAEGKSGNSSASGSTSTTTNTKSNSVITLNDSDNDILSPQSGDSKVNAFSGRGFTIGGEEKPADKPDRIVRRIPGIGLITSERPTTAAASTPLWPTAAPNTPLWPTKTGEDSPSQEAKSSDSVGKKRPIEEVSSDSDTDEVLERLRRKAKRRKSEVTKRNSIGLNRSLMLEEALSNTSPGSVRVVPGFKSVSRKGAEPLEFIRKDPRLVEQERQWLTKKGRFTPKGGLHILKTKTYTSPSASSSGGPSSTVSKPPTKGNDRNSPIMKMDFTSGSETEDEIEIIPKPKIKPPPQDLAFNRNRRAILGSDSDSDSDSDAGALNSIWTQKKQGDKDQNKPTPLSNPSTWTDSLPRPTWGSGVPSTSSGPSRSVVVPGTHGDPFGRGTNSNGQVPSTFPTTNHAVPTQPRPDPMRECPVCTIQVRESVINEHLDNCLASLG